MPLVYVPKPLKTVIARRRDALSNPDEGELVKEYEALVDMLEPQYEREFRHRRDDENVNQAEATR